MRWHKNSGCRIRIFFFRFLDFKYQDFLNVLLAFFFWNLKNLKIILENTVQMINKKNLHMTIAIFFCQRVGLLFRPSLISNFYGFYSSIPTFWDSVTPSSDKNISVFLKLLYTKFCSSKISSFCFNSSCTFIYVVFGEFIHHLPILLSFFNQTAY